MTEPQSPDPRGGDPEEPAHGGSDAGPPPARVPPPPGAEPPRFGISRAWQALTPAGQWVVALAWVAVFAAAIVGFGLALSGDDDGEVQATAQPGDATETAPVQTVPPTVTVPPPVVTVEEPPVIEEVPPVTEAVPEDEGSLPPSGAVPVFEADGEGPSELGEVELTEDSTIFWTNAGGDFQLQEGQADSATIIVNSIDASGQASLAAGVYTLSVVAGGAWAIQIIPS